ncbi:hypothetical protein HYH02_010200 [Chlamydomonas schloesseri]|uniref:Pherophorin domain-containing protein n=1 Tax=Chlamydomonas schloesseri TaxID=2026947 RepID=A0A835W908_9CHLO|nr:hypothetical protein HYH02_010200 [Chlamydomonas schloesseri]|eukprot:KAG2440621.1 hypothetical protein HYH02_010200 [Chlamydomonas schloesseri]
MRRTAVSLALLAFVAAASAQLDFPYAGCTRALSKSKYSVKPVTTFPGANQICWTVQYSNAQCANPSEACCNTDVKKLQLDVKPACATGFKASATVNGKGTPAPTIYRPPNAGADQYVLSITELGLNGASANGATICLTLEKGSCMSLASLTPSPVCATWAAIAGPNVIVDDLNFFGDADNCANAKDVIGDLFSPYMDDGTIIAGTTSITCKGNKVTACATLFSKQKGAKMSSELEALGADALVSSVFGFNGECPLALSGYATGVSSDDSDCGPFLVGPACAPPTTPFPFCVCNKDMGATPFYLDTAVAVNSAANEYCVSVYTAAANPGTSCTSATIMKKAEFWFDYSMRWKLTAITIRYSNGKTSTRSQSWGRLGDNTLKVSDLNWKTGDVASLKPKICFTFKSGTSLADFSMDDNGYVWASLFNPDQKCCPTFPAE